MSLSEIDHKLRHHIATLLRVCDEAVVLPQAAHSVETGALKNVVVRMDGEMGGVSSDVFSPNWFMGVSLVPVPNERAESLLSSPTKRKSMLKKLAEVIPSEMADSQLQVGPDLESDDQDRDVRTWTAGFDSPGCCAGLYSAMQSRDPDGATH